MKNINDDIKKAISLDVPWSFNDFYYCIENAKENGFTIYHSDGEDKWAGIYRHDAWVGYIWQNIRWYLLLSTNLMQRLIFGKGLTISFL